jgi:hypothetical protein
MVPKVQPDFTGKVVKVLLPVAGEKWQWWTLEEPTFELQYNRLFLVGRLMDSSTGAPLWGRTCLACFPWDVIQMYYVEAIADRQQRRNARSE